MKHLLYLSLLTVLFSSCLSSSELTGIIDSQALPEKKSVDLPDYLTISFPESKQTCTKCERDKGMLLPLIFAWYWSATTECELDPGVRKSFFREGIGESAHLLGLESHLGERTLDIEILEIPGAFRFKERGGFTIFLYDWWVPDDFDEKTITPDTTHLRAVFRIREKENIVWERELRILNAEQTFVKSRYSRDIRNKHDLFSLYLRELKKEIKGMTFELLKECILQMAEWEEVLN
jgi:hypothetical protein